MVPVLAGLLSGCGFTTGHGPQIQDAAQAALDASGQHGGVDMFNTSEGLSDSNYDIDICVEAPRSDDPEQLAQRLADTLNAVHDVTVSYATYVGEVHVRLVDEAKHVTDLDDWCRRDNSYRDLLDLTEAVTMIPGAGLGLLGSDLSISVPYGDVAVTPVPTPTPTPTPAPSLTT